MMREIAGQDIFAGRIDSREYKRIQLQPTPILKQRPSDRKVHICHLYRRCRYDPDLCIHQRSEGFFSLVHCRAQFLCQRRYTLFHICKTVSLADLKKLNIGFFIYAAICARVGIWPAKCEPQSHLPGAFQWVWWHNYRRKGAGFSPLLTRWNLSRTIRQNQIREMK